MARANKYVDKNQDTLNKKKKKTLFWSLIIVLGLIVIAGIVVLILWGVGVFDKDEDTPEYFTEEIYEQYKINYSQIDSKLDVYEMNFIFVYENETFDDLSDGDKNSVTTNLNNLITTISNKSYDIGFYMLDASTTANSAILENDNYGNFTFTPQLLFFYDSTYYSSIQSAIDANDENKVLENIVASSNKSTSFNASTIAGFINVLKNTKDLINNLNV